MRHYPRRVRHISPGFCVLSGAFVFFEPKIADLRHFYFCIEGIIEDGTKTRHKQSQLVCKQIFAQDLRKGKTPPRKKPGKARGNKKQKSGTKAAPSLWLFICLSFGVQGNYKRIINRLHLASNSRSLTAPSFKIRRTSRILNPRSVRELKKGRPGRAQSLGYFLEVLERERVSFDFEIQILRRCSEPPCKLRLRYSSEAQGRFDFLFRVHSEPPSFTNTNIKHLFANVK